MILKFIDQKIRRAFSDSALQYEALTSLHKEIGRELTHKIPSDGSFSKILDVGMGTGWFTNRLKNIFPDSLVVGLDFADGMIDAARKYTEGFRIIQAQACALPFKEASFDLIASNLAYQWVEDLTLAFRRSYEVLRKDGVLLLTMFGHETFQELFSALENSLEKESLSENSQLPVHRLAKREQIEAALQSAGFLDVHVDFERIKVRFPDMMGLIQWTKNIGANNLEKNIYIGKDLLLRANDYYNEHFKDSFGITATFEVVWASGRK
ncbi:MAG TPA: methyltransferase domain-containing protein [Candidatus Omnitrophota bacterium]|nr:methyltransferase domain-containing protein [Candidatus Omnitrophota bacterium]